MVYLLLGRHDSALFGLWDNDHIEDGYCFIHVDIVLFIVV